MKYFQASLIFILKPKTKNIYVALFVFKRKTNIHGYNGTQLSSLNLWAKTYYSLSKTLAKKRETFSTSDIIPILVYWSYICLNAFQWKLLFWRFHILSLPIWIVTCMKNDLPIKILLKFDTNVKVAVPDGRNEEIKKSIFGMKTIEKNEKLTPQ